VALSAFKKTNFVYGRLIVAILVNLKAERALITPEGRCALYRRKIMFDAEQRAFVAVAGDNEICLVARMANRHGLITGATGTGKTVTLQTLAETFSAMGVPVFASDVKGDLSGVAAAGGNKAGVVKRVEAYGLEARGFTFRPFPIQFWDVFGQQGVPIRARLADMGPLLLGRLLRLNETQTAVLHLIFAIARDESLELIDLKDLKKVLAYAVANAVKFSAAYGHIAPSSVGAVQRGLTALEQEDAELFFGEPELNICDLLRRENGMGVINILASDKLMLRPATYTAFLLWLLTRLFEALPEVGDADFPKLVFFFDEAHLLFNDAPKALLEKVEQVVRLIRSKGVGIYFISQTPADIPDSVLGQLGNRVQHALRAYTPNDIKALKAAARSFRVNPSLDAQTAIAELGIGEALISFLDADGIPRPAERAFILPPQGQIGPLDTAARRAMTQSSPAWRRYGQPVDRTSAYEVLQRDPDGLLSAKERAAREKAATQERKAEERARLREERQERREAIQTASFWNSLIRSFVAPFVRQIIRSLLRRR
jgi:DNA helicase HerA-like ATPase